MKLILLLTVLLSSGVFASEFSDTVERAVLGEAWAQNRLGVMLLTGEVVEENNTQAVEWFRAAADKGYAIAQFNLGKMYANGEGIPENSIRAYAWWSMAKAQGHKDAATNLDLLKPRMTKQQIAEAQALASKCYDSNYKDCD